MENSLVIGKEIVCKMMAILNIIGFNPQYHA